MLARRLACVSGRRCQRKRRLRCCWCWGLFQELCKGWQQRWWLPDIKFEVTHNCSNLQEQRATTLCSCAAEEAQHTDSAHELCSKFQVGSDFALDGHEFLEDMLSKETKVGNNVVQLVKEDSKEDFVAA